MLTPKNELADPREALRRFGQAVARDNWLVCDERSARALVDNLSRRALLAARNGEGSTPGDWRLRRFSQFSRLHRRHVRMAALEDCIGEAAPRHVDARDSGSPMERAVRGLPLDLRESLLLVVLEQFSHVEAAQALDISLAALTERLARARAMLAAALGEPSLAASSLAMAPAPRRTPYLRLVK